MEEKKTSQPILHKKSFLGSNLVTFVLLGLFLVLEVGLDALLKPTYSATGLVAAGIFMAVIPAIIWIVFFYRQDRLEPEPKGMVLQVFLLGGLVAAAVGIPLVNNVFGVSAWIYKTWWGNLLGAILLVGFTQEFLKYATVRFSVYPTAEFNERIDGIIYSTAAGVGYATVLSILFVTSSGGVDLGMGAVRVALTVLAQASFSGVTGYFLGREKLEQKPVWWTPLGVCIAALLNGLFYFFDGALSAPRLTATGSTVNPYFGLALAAVLAIAVTALLSWLIDRDYRRGLGPQEA
ncbi:MAG TPA: PrsW family glutamic-type intramembrane protease [Anaerolineaceae bacterium]